MAPAAEPVLIGIDVGTTKTKVGAFGLNGRQLALVAQRYPEQKKAGEQAAEAYWTAAIQALKSVLEHIDAGRLLAVSVGGQGPTVVGMDGNLRAVGPALTWMDNRARAEWLELNRSLEAPLPPHAIPPKIMWLKLHRRHLYDSTRYYCQAWDFVASQLCEQATVSTSPSIAPWKEHILDSAGLDRAKFPEMKQMASPIGVVSSAAAGLTGLPAGLPVIGGISDYFESLIGTGTLAPGLACNSGGTSESLNVCWDAALDVAGIFCLPSFDEGQWYVGGPAVTSGKALEWWCEQVLHIATADDDAMREASNVEAGSNGLIFLPYLAGERAPIWDPHARGVFFGLSLEHKRAHMTRAVLESVGYKLRHLLELIEAGGAQVREIRACGGQAQSQFWCQIKADICGRPFVMSDVTEAAVLGAAIIAGVGVGLFKDFAEGAERMVRPSATINPDMARHERYETIFPVFRDLYPQLKDLYLRLDGAIA